jgi:Flp pilus assembly protein TadD
MARNFLTLTASLRAMTPRNRRPPSPTNPTLWIWLLVIAIAATIDWSALPRLVTRSRPTPPTQPQITDFDALEDPLSDYQRHYQTAQAHFEKREYDRAALELEQALAAESDRPEGQLLLGKALRELGQLTEAEAPVREAIRLDPKTAGAYSTLSGILAEQDRYEAAIEAANIAIAQDGRDGDAHATLSFALARQGQFDQAIAAAQKALTLDPNLSTAYNAWGIVLANQGDYVEAQRKYEQALAIDPEGAAVYHNWGVLLMDQDDYAGAIAKFEASLKINPFRARTYSAMAWAFFKADQFEQAALYYGEAQYLAPQDAQIRYNAGVALMQMERYGEALTALNAARDLARTQEQADLLTDIEEALVFLQRDMPQ